jgi:hypothetical protein
LFKIPNLTNWCPENLQAISQLAAYYNQLPFDHAIANNWDLPNAIYLDVLDTDGTIRTGMVLYSSGFYLLLTLQERNCLILIALVQAIIEMPNTLT